MRRSIRAGGCATSWPSRSAPSACRAAPRCGTASARLLAQVGLAARGRRKIPARVLRRPAPAHLHRPRAVERAGVPGVRRADQRAGRVGAGADPEPDARPAAAAGADLSVHQPQPGRGPAHVGPAGRDVSRPHRRTGAGAKPSSARPRHPYTRLLLDAIPDLEQVGRPRTPVGGEVPSPIDPPPGCPFHPRCPLANERCRVEKPAHVRAGDALVACHAVAEGRDLR